MSNYTLRDSGNKEVMSTGSHRDAQDDKPRYDLIPANALYEVAMLYSRGAKKYGDKNWEKGQPVSRILASLMRHVEAFRNGDIVENHMAAVVFNALAIMHHTDMVEKCKLPIGLLDAGAAEVMANHMQARRIMAFLLIDGLHGDILGAGEDTEQGFLTLTSREILDMGQDILTELDLTGVTVFDVDAALLAHNGYFVGVSGMWVAVPYLNITD